jgi:hypothetical protein
MLSDKSKTDLSYYSNSEIISIEDLKNLLLDHKIDIDKFTKPISKLYEEILYGDSKLLIDKYKNDLIRIVSVVQLILADFDTRHFLVNECSIIDNEQIIKDVLIGGKYREIENTKECLIRKLKEELGDK